MQDARRFQPPPLPQAMPQGGYGVPTAAPAHVPMLVTLWTYGKGAIAALVLIFVLEWSAGLTGFSPSEAVGGFFGRISAAEMRGREAAEAEYRAKIAEAEAAVQRETLAYQAQLEWMTGSYQSAFERLSTVSAYAVQSEQMFLNALAEAQRAGQGGSNLAAGIADMACALGMFANDPSLARACGMGSALRENNIREIEQAVKRNAGQLTREMMAGLPDPQNLSSHLQMVAATQVPAAR